MTVINEEKKYRELKETIRMLNSERSDVAKINMIEEGKKKGINEVIKSNKVITNSLKPQTKNEILLLKVQKRY